MNKKELAKVVKNYNWKMFDDFRRSMEPVIKQIDQRKKDALKEMIEAQKNLGLTKEYEIVECLKAYETTAFMMVMEENIGFWNEVYKEFNKYKNAKSKKTKNTNR